MAHVTLTLRAHLPHVQRRVSVFDEDDVYFDPYHTRDACANYVRQCLGPVNRILHHQLSELHDRFSVNLCISGLLCDLLEQFEPAVLDSFKDLVSSDHVELLATPYHQGLAFAYDEQEFADQLSLHRGRMQQLFKQTPAVMCNTELIHHDRIAELASTFGYDAILCDGGAAVREGQNCDLIKQGPGRVRLLLRNDAFSRDVSELFDVRESSRYPITAPGFATSLSGAARNGDVINLVWDYSTFGQHYPVESGIFELLKHLPEKVLSVGELQWATCSEALAVHVPTGSHQPADYHCRAEQGGDLSGWLGTPMQSHAASRLFELLQSTREAGLDALQEICRNLQPADYLRAMSVTEWNGTRQTPCTGCVPGESPYDVYINYMCILDRLDRRARAATGSD